MTDIVIPEFMDEAVVASLSADFTVLYDRTLVDRPAELEEAATGARALIVRNRTQVRGDLLAAAMRLEAVGRLGVGLDNIDVAACQERGIAVLPATGANDVSVAEYVIAALLILLRRAYQATDLMRAGGWPREQLIGREASGTTLGLIGFGAIARAVARRGSAMEMVLIGHDPYLPHSDPAWTEFGVSPRPFGVLLAEADVVSLHVPLPEHTCHLIAASALSAMKPDAILINAARGGVVDETALAGALRSGRLGGAALDVFGREPLPVGAGFDEIPNLILTPHIAGVTEQSNQRVSALVAENVRRILKEGR